MNLRTHDGHAIFCTALAAGRYWVRVGLIFVVGCVTVASGRLLAAAAPASASARHLSADLQGLYRGSFALVIGAANYRNGWDPLPGALEDVKAISKLLSETGFEVTQVIDPTREELEGALRKFVELRGQDRQNRLVIYFAGHGVDVSIL